MTATRRRQVGAHTLAVFGIFALLAAFIPGIASADEPNTLPLSNGDPGDSWEDFEGEDCEGDLEKYGVEPGEYLWHVVSNPSGETYIDLYVPAWGISGLAGDQAGGGGYHWWIVNDNAELPAGPFEDTFYALTDGTSSGGQNIRISHACHEGDEEEETYLVIPEKSWIGIEGEGEGFEATITITPDDDTPAKSWTFDEEGNRDSDEPIEIPEGVGYTWSEDFTVPDDWECEAEEVRPEAEELFIQIPVQILDIVNTCEEDDTTTTTTPTTTPPGVTETTTPEPTTTVVDSAVEGETAEAPAEEAAAAETLPRTGAGVAGLAALGLSALMGGIGLSRFSRREDAQD